MNDTLLQLHSFLRDNGIMICFSGKLSQELIEEYGAAVKKYLQADDLPINEIHHVFSIFIELTQNMKRYSQKTVGDGLAEEISGSCMITIGKTDKGHYIHAGNLVRRSDLHDLVERIEKLIPLDKAEIKKLYKQKLREELPAGSASAGMGLIDIARKSSEPLSYRVNEISNDLSYFSIKANV